MIALTLPDTFRLRLNFHSGFVLDILHGWDELMALPARREAGHAARPRTRGRVGRLAQSTEGGLRAIANWGATSCSRRSPTSTSAT